MIKQSIAVAILGSLSTLAFAGESTVIPFGDLDMNKDDALSTEETTALPGIAAQWESLDADGNGQLNRGEYAGFSIAAPASGVTTK